MCIWKSGSLVCPPRIWIIKSYLEELFRKPGQKFSNWQLFLTRKSLLFPDICICSIRNFPYLWSVLWFEWLKKRCSTHLKICGLSGKYSDQMQLLMSINFIIFFFTAAILASIYSSFQSWILQQVNLHILKSLNLFRIFSNHQHFLISAFYSYISS